MLVLMPAAVLVFLVLGALAVDSAAVFLAQRQLANAASAAANDAATQAVDLDLFYAGGSVRLVPGDAQRVAVATVRRLGLDHLSEVHPVVTVRGDVVEVTVTARAHQIFAPTVPGGADTVAVAATAVAQGRKG
ncbi:MAG TPA: hypothetical protein VGV63_03480 [Acidimicrobiales bacterium]|nr:hypothetical protein [Acidimicrobiales bacterium]